MSSKFRIFVSVKQQVDDMTEALRGLSAQIESMQKTIDSQHSTICQINRNGQAQLKKINRLIAVSPCFGTPLRIRLFSTAPSLIA